MERRNVLLEDYLNELNQRCDNKNEHDGLEITQSELIQYEGLDRPCDCGSHQHNESNGGTHAGSLVELLGNSEERADTQELVKNVVVDKYAGHEDHEKCLDG